MSDGAGLAGIAIVGMACRFPGAADPAAFWSLLRAGRESIRHFSAAELAAAGVPAELLDDPNYVRARGALDGIEEFDAALFGLSGREASWLDPQHRLWLECAWEALEDAGYHQTGHARAAGGAVGVFAGCRASSYLAVNLGGDRARAAELAAAQDAESYQILLGNDKDFLSTRTSYLLDLRGPSVTVQSACSSSLVAVAQACQSLLAYQADLCLAGGVSVTVPSVQGYWYQEGGIHAPDGRCRAFDARARGTVFADGVGVVALKRLDEALADGDDIYAVIRGWAVNNDGAGKPSFAAPSVAGQAEVVALAQAVAGIDPRTVTYVEAHGTGTPLGDPVEIAALTRAFRLGTDATGFCAVGSVKTNIGHTDAAAGIAGLIKTALAFRHGAIPASLHFESPNPAIDFATSPFFIVRELTPWRRDGAPRRAGVTSLGVGGTNCHVILEEAPPARPRGGAGARPRHVLALSARSAAALAELARRHADHVTSAPDTDLGDVCFTLNTGRAALPHRLAVTAATPEELGRRLAAFACGDAGALVHSGGGRAARPGVAFLFTGQGAPHPGMGRVLYETQPVFRAALDRCDAILRPRLARPLLDALLREPAPGSAQEPVRAEDAASLQPALFSLQMALVELWRSWGVEPDVVAGHSAGELAAACAAGVFGLEEGLALVAERGRLMAALPAGGAMAAALAGEARVARVLAACRAGLVTVAAVNEPEHVVISGARADVKAATDALRAEGIETRPLAVTHAFHSPLMDPILAAFERAASATSLAPPRVRLVSTVTGGPAGPELATPTYWRDQIRRPVRFEEAVRALDAGGATVFVEIGPHPVLSAMARRVLRDARHAWLPSLVRGRPEWEPILESLGELHARGVPVDWRGFDAPYARRRRHLPTYPFQRRRHWVDAPAATAPAPPPADGTVSNPLLGRRLSLPLSSEIRFEAALSPRSAPHLGDHRLFGAVVVAAATDLALFLSAVEAACGPRACALEALAFMRPLVLPEGGGRRVQVVLAPEPDGLRALRLLSRAEDDDPHRDDAWTLHATARVRLADGASAAAVDLGELRGRCPRETSGEAFYRDAWGPGADTGPAFRWIETIWTRAGEAVSRTAPPDLPEDLRPYPLPPGLIEACFQTLFAAGEFETRALAESGVAYVPVAIARFAFHGRPRGGRLWCHGRSGEAHAADALTKGGGARLLHEDGSVIAEIDGFEVRRLAGAALRAEPGRDAGDGGRGGRDQGLGSGVPPGGWRDVRDMLWHVVWKPRAGPAAGPVEPGHWLVIADRAGLGERLAGGLERKGHRAIVMAAGDPGAALEPAALAHVLDGLPAASLRGVVHLRGIDAAARAGVAIRGAAEHARDLLHLAQALADRPRPPRLWVVTERAQPVLPGDDLTGAAQAALWGLGGVVARELPALASVCVDLDDAAASLPILEAELAAPDDEQRIAYRQGRRHVARLAPLGPSRPPSVAAPALKGDATYAVTDALSSQGQAVARWLVERGARHLLLATSAGTAGDGDPAAAHGEPDRVPGGPVLAALASAGATTQVLQLDTERPDEAARQLREALGSMPPLRGLVFLGDVMDDGIVAAQTAERLTRALAPAALAWGLSEATGDAPLDFFVCFSSSASLLGTPGQCSYAAASALLDALAHRRQRQGRAGLSINWGPWAEVGKAAELPPAQRARASAQGWRPLATEMGLHALGALIDSGVAQAGVLSLDWTTYREAAGAGPPRFLEDVVAGTSRAPHRGPDDDVAGSAESSARRPLGDPTASLRQCAAEVLGLSLGEVRENHVLLDLGLDSLAALVLANRLRRELGASPSMAMLMGPASIADLAAALAVAIAAG